MSEFLVRTLWTPCQVNIYKSYSHSRACLSFFFLLWIIFSSSCDVINLIPQLLDIKNLMFKPRLWMFILHFSLIISESFLITLKKLNLFLHSVCKFYNKCLFLQFPLSWILSFSFQPKCENKLGQWEAGNKWINAHMGKPALLILSEMLETWDHHREKPPTVFRKQEVMWSSTQSSLCCPLSCPIQIISTNSPADLKNYS